MERQSLTDQQLQTVLRSPRLPDCSSSTLPAGDAAEALLPWFGGGQARATCVTPAGKGSATTRRSTTYSEREASTSSRGAPERRPGAAAVLGRPAPGAPTRTAPASRRPRTDWSEASIAKGGPASRTVTVRPGGPRLSARCSHGSWVCVPHVIVVPLQADWLAIC